MKKAPVQKKHIVKKFPVVAIGASAGGLEAMSALLKQLPENTGMAYIYVQHLSPDHKSFLTSILSKITKMKVQEIENMEFMAPNNVYIIPPNRGIEVIDGHIKLLPHARGSAAVSVDVLFSSLAETHKENVIGVILSGYASDGAIGIKAIKDAGGITFAQDDSAQAGSMPSAAIATGAVDFILSPEEIAAELIQFQTSGFKRNQVKSLKSKVTLENANSDLNSIFELLLKTKGVDFSHYKMTTIKRRLNHKMSDTGCETIKEYVELLLENNKEIDNLYTDLLVNVTSFFRDKEAFQYLKNTLFPLLLKNKTDDDTLRIWVPACSTGQEAYSMAILLTELQDKKAEKIQIKIFATDLSKKAIHAARLGGYSPSEVKGIPKKSLERFFTKIGDKYQVSKELRDICVFAPHNILRDPPFSRMDFISCRNVLIYFDSAAQKKVFTTLHFALNDVGYLMLGKAETVGSSSAYFNQIDSKNKIYIRKKNAGVRKIIDLKPRFPRTSLYSEKMTPPTKSNTINPTGIDTAIDSVILSQYMPACVVVNKEMEIIQFRGPISTFLTHSSGKASLNILKMTRPEFAFELRNTIQNVIKTKQTIKKTGIEIVNESSARLMSFEVSPLKIDWDEPLMLIVFTMQDRVNSFIENEKTDKKKTSVKDLKIIALKEELNSLRAEINTILEAQETTYEELQAANEEIISTNEEFQTLNEELETSKEEIEATNEELISTNQELQVRNEMITDLNEFSESIIATMHEPLVVLTSDFKVYSANKAFYSTFQVSKEETEGEALFELGNEQWNIPKIREVLHDILSKNSSLENFEVIHSFPGIGEKVMLLNAHLIIRKTKSDKLILLAIQDVTERANYYLKEKYALSIIEASLDPLITINAKGKITDLNKAAVHITGIERVKLIGTDFFDYFTEPQKVRKVYKQVFLNGSVADFPLTLKHKSGKLTDVLFSGSVYKDSEGNVHGAVVVAKDIAEQKWVKELGLANKELAFQNDEKEKRAQELIVANKELAFQNDEKEKRAQELSIANTELAFQNNEKEKRAEELIVANKELAYQNTEKEKRAQELIVANKELAFQNDEKEKRAQELSIANTELAFQNNEKEKRAEEFIVANKELAYQNAEKEKRAAELSIANKELAFQSDEKEKRAQELIVANKELEFQNIEKEKVAAELRIANYARSLIEASRDPLVTINIDGKITDMNEALARTTGVSRKNLKDSDFFNYFTEPEKARQVYREVFDKGSVADFPLTLRHKNGKLIDVLFNGSVYSDDKENILGVVIVARDVTAQKLIEKEITEAKVFAELATGIAEDAVKTKQQFLSNMSHEIRTPMNAIIGFTKVVMKTELTPKQKEYLTAIKLSGDALIVLINDILDLAKVDAGKMTFEKTPFKLEASISAMLHIFEPKILEKNLELIKNYDSKIPEVLVGDPVRLHQIILNLVSNAVKFTTKGKITVEVRLLKEDKRKVYLEFSVSDTGIGIPKNAIEGIFNNFQQATSNTSRLFGGTGLGLAIVKQLVESQGGQITVNSVIGKGSTFSFTLNFLKTTSAVKSDLELTALSTDIKNIRVLVVEDIALNQLLMKTLLDDFGFTHEIAENGKIAIEKLKNSSFDLVLMDLQMPEMNGFEATDYIRNEMHSKIPIVALTADVTTVDLEKCKKVGMNDYIAKPIDERLLYSKIIGTVKKAEQIIPESIKEKEMPVDLQEKCVDMQHLEGRTKSNPALMKEMILIFLDQTPKIIRDMKVSLKNKDWELLKGSAHKMIPSFAIMGIHCDNENTAATIQEYAQSEKNLDKLPELVSQLDKVCNKAYEELEEELKRLKKIGN